MTNRSGLSPASTGKSLTIRTDEESGSDTLERAEDAQDRADIAKLEQRIAETKAQDKIGTVVGYGRCFYDQSPTEVFGPGLVAACKNDVSKIPDWRFTRWYSRDKIIVDLFCTKQAYAAADVEARRRMAKKHGVRYAALGPTMSYRTDLPQQLGL